MLGGFDDHFVLAHSIHLTEEALCFLAGQTSLGNQSRKLIGYSPHPPAGTIGGAPFAVSHGFGRGHAFVARTEGTILLISRKGNGWDLFS